MLVDEIAWLPRALSIVLVLPLNQIVFAALELIDNTVRKQRVNLNVVKLISVILSLNRLLMIHQVSVGTDIEPLIETL